MTTKLMRRVVRIDEEKCTGCGLCVPNCAEGALKIIDGKVRLVNEKFCDGLGACLGHCPEGAITVEERPAEGFDEGAVELHLQELKHEEAHACPSTLVHHFERPVEKAPLPCGCPGSAMRQFEKPKPETAERAYRSESMLAHWPVQLALVPPTAPFLQGADLLLAADCVPFAYPGFHEDLLAGHALLISCPKLDDYESRLNKLTQVFKQSDIRGVTVAHMEVPCCMGLVHMARQAIAASGKNIPLKEVTIGVRGEQL